MSSQHDQLDAFSVAGEMAGGGAQMSIGDGMPGGMMDGIMEQDL